MSDWLSSVLAGVPDADAIEHLRRGFGIWLRGASRATRDSEGVRRRVRPVSLAGCLGLHDNPMLVRQVLRNRWLRAAAHALDPDGTATAWARARMLAAAVRRFDGHQWHCWLQLENPPPNAGEADRALFFAFRAGGGNVPRTARGLHNIIH